MQNSTNLRTVIVTGANKGIGYSIVETLLQGETPYDIILAARNVKLGEEAQASLAQKHPSSVSKVTFRQLNIDDVASVDEFVDWIKSARHGKVDVLVNNAGIADPKETIETKINTLNTNFLYTVRLTEKVLPYLATDGKVIMVSSGYGRIDRQKGEAAQLLENNELTREQLFEGVNRLVEKTKEGKQTELGWSEDAYGASKALLNAYLRFVLVKELKGDQQGFTLCPGWCKTDMGGQTATSTSEEGAATPVYLINLPFKRDDNFNGKFFTKSAVRSF